jgi:hypothetical protein
MPGPRAHNPVSMNTKISSQGQLNCHIYTENQLTCFAYLRGLTGARKQIGIYTTTIRQIFIVNLQLKRGVASGWRGPITWSIKHSEPKRRRRREGQARGPKHAS